MGKDFYSIGAVEKMMQIAHEETCVIDHASQNLSGLLECAISHCTEFLKKSIADSYSIRHNMQNLSFPMLPADLSSDLVSGAALTTNSFDRLELGRTKVCYISIESVVDGCQIIQKIGPFNSLSEVADSSLKSDLVSLSGKCALIFRIESRDHYLDHASDLSTPVDLVTTFSKHLSIDVDGDEFDDYFSESLVGSLESLNLHLQSKLDRALVDLSAAQIGAENYKHLFESQVVINKADQKHISDLKNSISWRITSPIRTLHKALSRLVKK